MPEPIEGAATGAWVARTLMFLTGVVALLKAKINANRERIRANSRENERLWNEIADLRAELTVCQDQIAFDTAQTKGLQLLVKEMQGIIQTVMTDANNMLVATGKPPKYTPENWDYASRIQDIDRDAYNAVERARQQREYRELQRKRERGEEV